MRPFKTAYGNVSAASIGAIQRGLLALEQQGADKFFGEPALDLDDLLQTDNKGNGVINILAADKLYQSPKVYATFLLWLLAELFEQLPEVGDLEKPKLVFFFDEAHLIFNDAPQALLEKIEQVVRLIRSKGVGVFFISQNPMDIPETVLGQLGNRLQHALRAFTPRDQKAVRVAAQTFRVNPELDTEKAITELGVGEALVSFLDEKGAPGIVQRAFVCPPHSQIGGITPEQRQKIVAGSVVYGHYEKVKERASAYEMLLEQAKEREQEAEEAQQAAAAEKAAQAEAKAQAKAAKTTKRQSDDMITTVMKSAGRAMATQAGRELTRGLLGSLLGGTTSRRR